VIFTTEQSKLRESITLYSPVSLGLRPQLVYRDEGFLKCHKEGLDLKEEETFSSHRMNEELRAWARDVPGNLSCGAF
jgi:hypothetical protein